MTELALTEAVPLAHAVVDRVARDHDVRVLFIKGPAAAAQGLRAERVSLDVDALVDPARRPVLAAALTELGWVDENPYTSPTVLPMHSLTHRHPKWPCELDLHDRFPGFFVGPQDVFERLWSRRSTVEVANREIPCPDRAGQALVLALHALRDPNDPGKAAELTDLVDRVSTWCDRDALRDLADLARDLGAADTAAPFLSAVGAPAVGRGSTGRADLHAWQLRTQPADATAVSWVAELRRLPKRAWPRYLWYAATLSDTELRLAEPGLAPGRSSLLRARGRRLRRGLGALPHALRNVRTLAQVESESTSEVSVRTTWQSRPLPPAVVRLATAGLGFADRAVVPKRGVVIRTFRDFDDQGLETTAALADAGIGPLTWLAKADDPGSHAVGRLPAGVRIVDADSLAGVAAYLRARVVVHTHGVYGIPSRSPRKLFVNLWHGWGTKQLNRRPLIAERQSDLVTVTSELHADAVAEAWGLAAAQVRTTGLPRNDVLVRASRSPRSPALVARIGDSRPLVLWLPTYRRSVVGEIRVDGQETDNDFQLPHVNRDAVESLADGLGVHLLVKTHPMAPVLDPGDHGWLGIWDDRALAATGMSLYELVGQADVLVTDYSSVWVDYLLTDRPIVFAMADAEEYGATRGHYSPGLVDNLPGPTARDLGELRVHLAEALADDPWAEQRRALLPLHHTHVDDRSAARVAALIADDCRSRSTSR